MLRREILGLHPISWRCGHGYRLETSDQYWRSVGKSGFQVLIDCGLFQGPKEWRERNWRDTPIPAKEIDAVILTHAHLDHCGWIPRLVKEGFRGPIYATPPTIDLCGIILPDSGHLQEEDARFYNKTKKSKHDPALPLYTFEEAQSSLQYFKPVKVDETVKLSPEFSFRFVRAAHILGSCMAEVSLNARADAAPAVYGRHWAGARSQGCAGQSRAFRSAGRRDCRPRGDGVDLRKPRHPKEDPMPELAALIRATAERGGSVIVPAFAIERTQKFVFILEHLIESGLFRGCPCFATARWRSRRSRFF